MYLLVCCFLKKNLNASRPFEHPPVGGENVKTFRSDHTLQIQNLFMAFKRVPRWQEHWVNGIVPGINPPLCCILTLIAMQEHQKKT